MFFTFFERDIWGNPQNCKDFAIANYCKCDFKFSFTIEQFYNK